MSTRFGTGQVETFALGGRLIGTEAATEVFLRRRMAFSSAFSKRLGEFSMSLLVAFIPQWSGVLFSKESSRGRPLSMTVSDEMMTLAGSVVDMVFYSC